MGTSVVDGRSCGGCIFKVAFETDPDAVIFRLMRHMKEEKKEINICLEAKDWSEWFLRYSEATAMVITTEIRRDKNRVSSVLRPTSKHIMSIFIYLVLFDEFYLANLSGLRDLKVSEALIITSVFVPSYVNIKLFRQYIFTSAENTL